MKITELQTPAILVNMDYMEHNLTKYCNLAKKHKKQIWPMIKTHKSTELAKLQQEYGCTGFLCGNLDEAEAMIKAGMKNVMYAYPVATDVSIARVLTLTKLCNTFYIRIDGVDAAKLINDSASISGVVVKYTIIVDSGLHRFGVAPDKVVELADALKEFKNLEFCGISSHPGHVYGACTHEDISNYVKDEVEAIDVAARRLRNAGYTLKIISSGSTPTFEGAISDSNITIYHPGNYIFNDTIQLSTRTATEAECALYVLASVVSHPSDDLFICDAGTKCFGLDQGAHGNTSIKGYGTVKGHPELTVTGLSEEVGKLHVNGTTDLKVGDKICIIPNHSCSSANLTSYLIGVRKDTVDHPIKVDIRGNSTLKNIQ
ncbi:alanine racemase [Megasphaera hexanoica]|uniref:Alanine racemase n=1 Tax=Megasphaera hexanoica TaxID=1675036 RepID=A0A848BSZ2_9FIRM|nr:alanine racemase [Megasphaera hexanoica]AXB83147.1 amino acid racemase [Megasphaera hexanoica]MCI5531152.1 alanine racemase [Caecibacter massiliensis]NME27294.1 amino-acid racemase [Megasphaera hexanoica]